MTKKIAILGSTGSIGTQALDIIKQNPEKYKVTALTCNSSLLVLKEQIIEFKPDKVCVGDEKNAFALREAIQNEVVFKQAGINTEILFGKEGLNEIAMSDCDLLLNSLVGMMGMVPTYHAIKKGTNIALANKETLVAGGEVIMAIANEKNVKILPVDSEHSAIFQALAGNNINEVKKIYLTASGGPFRGYTRKQLESVTLEQALKHPNWSMGRKITIDSASMMNKGLEVIEAKWLFDIEAEKIEVVVHPQSIIHSMVEFVDNSIIAQMGDSDMRVPISYALEYPNRLSNSFPSLDVFGKGANMTFEKPDFDVFKTLRFSYEACKIGGSYPVVLNAANEVFVEMFLNKRIRFNDIQNYLEEIMNTHISSYNLTLDDILEIDKKARRDAHQLIQES